MVKNIGPLILILLIPALSYAQASPDSVRHESTPDSVRRPSSPDSLRTRQLDSVTVSGKIIHKDQITTAVRSTLSGQALDETRLVPQA